MECIDLTEEAHYSEGCYSLYYKLSSTLGLKVYASNTLRRVRTEFEIMKTLHRAKLAPKPYRIVKVIYKDSEIIQRYGIVCEHIRGLEWNYHNDYKREQFKFKVQKYVTIRGDDLFGDNIRLCPKRHKPVVVDFGGMYLR